MLSVHEVPLFDAFSAPTLLKIIHKIENNSNYITSSRKVLTRKGGANIVKCRLTILIFAYIRCYKSSRKRDVQYFNKEMSRKER